MINFQHFKLLKEAITPQNIIDVYILMSMPEPDTEANQYIKNEIIDKSKQIILDEIDNIIIRELRHMESDNLTYYPEDAETIIKMGIDIPTLNKLVGKLTDMYGDESGDDRYFSVEINLKRMNSFYNTHISRQNIAKMFIVDNAWEEGYGGNGWRLIALAADSLNKNSNDQTEFLKQLDRFVDFVHNNGSIMNKFRGYEDKWIQYILDIKQHAINIRALIPYSSRSVQKMFADPSWRMFLWQIPGSGASTSLEVYKKLLQDYAKSFNHIPYIRNVISSDFIESASITIFNIGNMVSKMGTQNISNLIKDIFTPEQLKNIFDFVNSTEDPDSESFIDILNSASETSRKYFELAYTAIKMAADVIPTEIYDKLLQNYVADFLTFQNTATSYSLRSSFVSQADVFRKMGIIASRSSKDIVATKLSEIAPANTLHLMNKYISELPKKRLPKNPFMKGLYYDDKFYRLGFEVATMAYKMKGKPPQF